MALSYEEFAKEVKKFSALCVEQRKQYLKEEQEDNIKWDSKDPRIGLMYYCDTISISLTNLAIRLKQADEWNKPWT